MRSPFALFGFVIGVYLAGTAAAPAAERTDLYGDPLPPGAVARVGTVRFFPCRYLKVLCYSPDGQYLASDGVDRGVCLWDATDGKLVHRLDGAPWHVYSVAFSRDGNKVAALSASGFVSNSGGEPTQIDVWDPTSGKHLETVEASPKGGLSLAFAEDGKSFLTVRKGATTAIVSDAETGKVLRELKADWLLHSAFFSADGRTVGAQDRKTKFYLWDPATGNELRSFEMKHGYLGPDGSYRVELAFSPDGGAVVQNSYGQVHWYLAENWARPQALRRTYATAFAVSPDGKTLAGACMEGIRRWDAVSGEEISPPQGRLPHLNALYFSPDGKRLTTAGGDQMIRRWDAATGKELGKIEMPTDGYALAFSLDGTAVAWGLGGESVRVCSTFVECECRRLSLDPVQPSCAAFSADGRSLAVGTRAGRVFFWDLGAGKPRWVYKPQRRETGGAPRRDRETSRRRRPVVRLAFAPAGDLLAAAMPEGDVRLLDAAGGEEIRRLPGCASGDCSLAFFPDGKALATASSEEEFIRVWDLSTGEEMQRLKRRRGEPPIGVYPHEAVVTSPDGRTLASGNGVDGSIFLYETATGECRHLLEGHRGGVYRLAYSADGRLLASASEDDTVLLWDLAGQLDGATRKREDLWDDLVGRDAGRAYEAVRLLGEGGDLGTLFLRQRLRPVPFPDSKKLRKWISELSDDEYAVRQTAAAELAALSDAAAGALREAAGADSPVETRTRARQLLQLLSDDPPSGERLRQIRAVEVLERMNTADARRLLQDLSEGAAAARLTREAKAALERLAKRQAAP